MLPVEVRIVPTYKVVADLGLLNTYAGLSIPLIASATALPMDQAAEKVYQTVGRIMAVAEQYHKPPHVVARKRAARRIELIGSLGRA